MSGKIQEKIERMQESPRWDWWAAGSFQSPRVDSQRSPPPRSCANQPAEQTKDEEGSVIEDQMKNYKKNLTRVHSHLHFLVAFLRKILFEGLECVCYSFAYVAHLVFLRDVGIRTKRATGYQLSHPSPDLPSYFLH